MNTDKKLIIWQIIYTLLLAVWAGILLLGPEDDCIGAFPGWWTLWFGVLPSALILALVLWRPRAGYWAVVIWGGLVLLSCIVFQMMSGNSMWLIVNFALFGFIIEGAIVGTRCLRVGS